MKYFRSQNLNPGNILDNTISVLSNGDVEINPTNRVTINGDLRVTSGNVSGPEVTNVMYVTMDGNDDNTGFGEGPDQAKRTLKSALAVAQEGTTIFIRSGEYYEDNPLRMPPKTAIIGDNLRRVIVRPLNGPLEFNITHIERTDNIVTITTTTAHGLNARDRVRVRCSNSAVDQTDINLVSVTEFTMSYRQIGTNITYTAASGSVKHGIDLFLVNSQCYMAGMVFKGLRSPAYCINIDSDAIVDTSPYVQNCSNINGPWMKNGQEWIPFVTEQPDKNGTMVTGPRPLKDDEIQIGLENVYGIDIEGAGGGMLIDGDRYSSESPIKSMVADAFTQVSQGGVGFHITNFGYMQLVSCFAVFCSKAFYTTFGGYLSISNSVIDFGTEGFVADGYYLDPYAEGEVITDYYSSVGSVTVVTEGAGYDGSSPIVVTIQPPTSPGGVQATATANYDPITGKLNAISVDDAGSGYDFVPSITITGGGATIDATALVNLNKNLTVKVDYLPSKPQVGSVMFIGNDPEAYYISNTVGTITPFAYNETKCRRDTGYIIDGVYFDAAMGTNYNSVINGRAYRRAMASEVIDGQLTQTVGAINYLGTLLATEVASNPTAISRSNSAIAEVVDIIENGVLAADPLVFPNPTGASTNVIAAKDQLIANRTFIVAEITAWIADQVAGSIAPFSPTFTYDVATCARDVGYIVDALCYDILYGGNSATLVAVSAYFENSVSVLPVSQRAPTAAAFARLKSVVGDVVTETAVVPSSTNTETQNTAGTPATSTERTDVENLVQVYVDVITANSLSGAPAQMNPSIAWVDAGVQAAVANLSANRSTIIDDTILFIDEEYASVFTYDQQKCKRDVGIITNAVLTDMSFASNYQSTAAGVAYLRSYSSKVTSLQKSQTIAGLEEARDQVLSYTTNPTAVSRITTNFNTVIDIIDTGLAGIPTLALPPLAGVRGGFAEAAAILEANKTFIQDEIEAWIAVNYPTLVYNVAKCRRDIGYITDALRYDLIYEGNQQTVNAALAYVEGSVIQGQVEETQEAYEYWKAIIGDILTNTAIDRSIGNTTTQNVVLPIGSPVAPPNSPTDVAEGLLQIIIDAIDHGPGYIPDPISYPNYSNGDAALTPIRTLILANLTDIQDAVIDFLNVTYGGSITVSVFPAILNIPAGTRIRFHNVSTISTGGTALEYVGAGVTYNALPFFGGEPVPANERIEINNGKCFTVTNDQVGNYRIGEFFTVNALTGAVTIDAENLNLSGLAAIGPFKRNGIPVGVQLREVSDNNNLISSTGVADGNTVPTQRAVQTYTENRYLNKVGSTAQTVVSSITFNNNVTIDQDLQVKGGDLTTNQPTFNLINTNATTVNFAGAATNLQIGAATGTTNVNNNLTVDGELVAGNLTAENDITGLTTLIGTGAEEYTLKIKGGSTGAYLGVGTKSDPAYGIVNHVLKSDTSGYLKYTLTASEIHLNIQDGTSAIVQTDALKVTATGYVSIGSNIASTNSTNGALVVTGGVGIGGALNVSGNQNVGGNLDVAGTIMSTSQNSFDLLNTNVTTLNFAKDATAISMGDTSGTTTINNDLSVLGNVTLGDSVSDQVTINGTFEIALPDNTASAFELLEGLNSYIKIDTVNGLEKLTFGANPIIVVGNTTDSSSSTSGSVQIAGGVGIAKKLYVGSDFTVNGSTTLGNEVSTDTNSITGTVDSSVPGNTAAPFKIRENLNEYFTVVTTTANESVSIGTTPKLKVLNTTDSTTKDTGALIVEGGVGIEKNLTVGVDLQVDRNTTVTGDLAVNGGDLTTTATTFNLLNATATTVNFAGAATAIEIGAATGTTNINNNLDVDGDVNIDGGDLTVSTTTFNLANTTAVTVNFAGAATTLTMAATTGNTRIRNNLDVDIDLNVDGQNLTTTATTFNLVNTTATTVNFAGAATAIEIGAATGTTNINNNLDVDGDVNIDGGDLTVSTATFNLANTNATTVNFAGAGTIVNIGAATGTTNIKNDLDVDGDVNIDGGDLTVSTATFNLANTTATTVNAFGAGTAVNIGAATGTTNVKNNLQVDLDLDVRGGDITTNQTTFNLLNTTATTVNAFGAGTAISIGAATGTTDIKNNLNVTGDLDIDGGDLTTSATTFNLVNATATTVNFAGAATTIEIGAATGTTNINNDLVVDGDVQIKGGDLTTNQSTFNVLNSPTTVNAFAAATSLEFAVQAAGASTLTFGAAYTGNELAIASTSSGTIELSSGVVSGIVNIFTGTTGTINLGTAGAATVNIGGTGSTVNIKTLTLTTDLEVQYGGTGQSSFTTNGVIYGNNASGLLVTAASNPGVSNATTSYGILTTDASNVPVWTDTIDGGSY